MGVTIWVIYAKSQNPTTSVVVIDKSRPAPRPLPAKPPANSGHTGGSSLFEDPALFLPGNEPSAKPKPAPSGGIPPTPPANPTDTGANTADAARADSDFHDIDNAHMNFSSEPNRQIAIYAEYRNSHPNSAFAADVNKYVDDALDHIWWLQIDKRILRRQKLKQDISTKQTDIESENNAEYKKKLIAEKAAMEKELNEVKQFLADRNYESETRPEGMEESQLKELRDARDANPDNYNKWKTMEYNRIKSSHGTNWE